MNGTAVLPADLSRRRAAIGLAGVVAGAGVVLLLALPAKWTVASFAGLAVACAALFQSDLRRYFQVLLVLSIPLALLSHQFFARRDYFGTPGVAFGLVDVVLVALYAAWLLSPGSLQRARAAFLSAPGLAGLGLVAAGALSVLGAADRALALLGLVAVVRSYLVFLYVAANVRETAGLRWIVNALVGAVLVQEVLGLAQYLTRSSLGLTALGESGELMTMAFGGEVFVRVGGTLLHPNQFANFLGLVLPIALAMLVLGRRPFRSKVAFAAVFVLGLLVFIVTFSRTGWLHVAASTAVVLAFALRGGKVRTDVANFLIVGALVAAMLLLVFSGAIYARVFHSDPILVTARLDMGKVALRMIADRPVLGVGINNYVRALPSYDRIGVLEAPVHDLYLLLAAETGLAGLAAFGAFVALVFGRLLRAARSSDALVKAVAVGIAAGFVGFLVDGISDFSFVLASTNLLFWFLAGLATALGPREEEGG